MDQTIPSMLAALESPLTPPADEVFNPAQWTTLMSLLDTIIPAITTSESEKASALCVPAAAYAESRLSIQDLLPSSTDPSVISAYLSESATSIPSFQPTVHQLFARGVPTKQVKAFRFILSSLNSRAGCLLLTGSTTPFHLQPPATRGKILIGWSRSYLATLRGLFRSVSLIAKRTWIWTSPTLPKIIGFPAVPKHSTPGTDHPYTFLDFSSPETPPTIETDVLIIGSGCGAGVCAKNLAQAGFKVVVAEKGYRFPSTHYPMQARDGAFHLMENSGAVTSDDTSVVVLAGSTFGGGGTVNWSASLQTQEYVRQEWADQGLPFFTSAEFQKCLDQVCGYIGATTSGIKHNFANRTLLEGSRRLGYHAKDVPQNTGGKEHYCGYCTFGCASGAKHGPAAALFPSAAVAGAQFVQGFDVRKIEFDEVGGTRKAVGAQGVWTAQGSGTRREIRVKASKVIVSAGTLNSPLVLMRSGVKTPHVGKNLHLHPAAMIGARFDETTKPWEGGILTSVNTSLENLDGHGHGCKIECTTMMPSYFLPPMSWISADQTSSPGLGYKTRVAAFHHHVGFVVISRDRDTGSVYPDPDDGRARVTYTTSALDAHHLVEGSIAAAKVAYANGAREVFTMNEQLPPFVRSSRPRPTTNPTAADFQEETTKPRVEKEEEEEEEEEEEDGEAEGISNAAFQLWLQQLRRTGVSDVNSQTLASAHQMGTCRMSSSPQTGVVDPKGRVWGFGGQEGQKRASEEASLYVADASVFPSASGVNPMVTTLAIAEWVSSNLVKDARKQEAGKGGSQGRTCN